MAITFDDVNKVIIVGSPTATVTIQEIVNAVRDHEDELPQLGQIDQVINASGKQDLGGGNKVGITLELVNNWRLQFGAAPGPTVEIRTVSGGNIVATNDYSNQPIKSSSYVQVVISQSASPTIAAGALTVAKFLALK